MYKGLIVTAFFLVFMLPAAGVMAGSEAVDEVEKTPVAIKNQTHCPVMGGAIDSTVYTDIQGQRVYHCCPMCSKALKADPDRYFEKAAQQGVLFENIQTACPVSGEKLKDKDVFTDYMGRRVYFCCEKCIDEFGKDPKLILSRLDTPSKMENSPQKEHGQHNHGR